MSSFLDRVNADNLDDSDRRLLSDIKEYFVFFKKQQAVQPAVDFTRFFLTFAYNLHLMGLRDEAIEMMDHCNPGYYKVVLLNDMRMAETHWQKAENLKNRVDKASKEQEKLCRMEAEFLIVALGMAQWLSGEKSFHGRSEFREFLDNLKKETFSIRIPPKIGLVKE
jgi:hypothetical protein